MLLKSHIFHYTDGTITSDKFFACLWEAAESLYLLNSRVSMMMYLIKDFHKEGADSESNVVSKQVSFVPWHGYDGSFIDHLKYCFADSNHLTSFQYK
jgi:hypothetical protein